MTANPLLSLFRRRPEHTEEDAASIPEPGLDTATREAMGTRGTALSEDYVADRALDAMLNALRQYLPPRNESLPEPTVSVFSANQRALGLGNLRNVESRSGFAVVEMKGVRFDAVARFQLWASDPSEADRTADQINRSLLADRNTLRAKGFLRLDLEKALPVEYMGALDAWRKAADYRLLFEFIYPHVDSQSLLVRVPVVVDAAFGESFVVTKEIVRWDNETAPALIVGGPFLIRQLAALSFVAGQVPTGAITLRRTFKGATDSPTRYSDLASLLAATADPAVQERHGEVIFPSLTSFLDSFAEAGDPVLLGDWDQDGATICNC